MDLHYLGVLFILQHKNIFPIHISSHSFTNGSYNSFLMLFVFSCQVHTRVNALSIHFSFTSDKILDNPLNFGVVIPNNFLLLLYFLEIPWSKFLLASIPFYISLSNSPTTSFIIFHFNDNLVDKIN